MFALNFVSPYHEELLRARIKNVTIRLGDVRNEYPENSVVWITFGKKLAQKKKLYTAFIDKVYVKKFSQLTAEDLIHQNPEITSAEKLIEFFEKLYNHKITPEDLVSVIYFSEVVRGE